MAEYRFSRKSLERLNSVKPQLKNLMLEALKVSLMDFGISEGKRSYKRQKELLKEGKTQTMNSKHLTGDAVDTVCIIDGQAKWDHEFYIDIADAVRRTAVKRNCPIRWGGAWTFLVKGKKTQDLRNADSAEEAHNSYIDLRKGKKKFFDLVHFEILQET